MLNLSDNSLWIATGALVLTVLSAITVVSGIFLLFETDMGPVSPNTLQFHDAFYFVATTLATIGYGDIVPVTLAGKMLVIAMMSVAVVVIPLHSAKILHLTNIMNQTGGVYYPQYGISTPRWILFANLMLCQVWILSCDLCRSSRLSHQTTA